jgi:hypothetical protein
LAVTLGVLAVFFDGYGRPEVFATLYGAIAEQGITKASSKNAPPPESPWNSQSLSGMADARSNSPGDN